jgi:L-2-hydroxyglutarate oxidase LhgO
VRGKALLYAYCAERRVPHRRLGKLVVATDPGQRDALAAIAIRARACGVDDLETLEANEVARLEPTVACVAALWSPSSGIVDSYALMLSLLADAEAAGATLALSSRVTRGAIGSDGRFTLHVASGDEATHGPYERRVGPPDADNGACGDDVACADATTPAHVPTFEIDATTVVNCASLDASRVARAIDGLPPDSIPETYLVKGSYFALQGRSPWSHLVYPLPEPGGLGIHVTLDLDGHARFGPDVEWPEPGHPLDYAVDARRAGSFAASIRRYWPGLPEDALAPAYAGLRPRISARGEPLADFAIVGPDDHGVADLVNLFGIESPGLTASLAIGEHVARLLA